MSTSVQLSKLAVLLTKEDHQSFAKLECNYRKQFQPNNAVELTLFTQLVLAAWNIDRTHRLEANLTPESDPLLDQAQSTLLARIANYRLRAERTLHKCLKELRSLAAKPISQNEPNRLRYKLVYHHPPATPRPKLGRNTPCPCGSGNKFKVCCLRKELEPSKAA